MFKWLHPSRGEQRLELTGAPKVRRQKTYSAESGYVYQYYYQGHRTVRCEDEEATEYVFEVSADRKTAVPVSVLLGAEALRSWEQAHARPLTSVEQYAVAKIALLQAFDERTEPRQMALPIIVRASDAEGISQFLHLD